LSSLDGLYVGQEKKLQFNPNTRNYEYINRRYYYLFFPDGRVYAGLPRDFDRFDFDAALKGEPDKCGQYAIQQGQIVFTWLRSQPTKFLFSSGSDYIKLGNTKLYPIKLAANDLKLDGVYANQTYTSLNGGAAGVTGGVSGERAIAFHGNGQFTVRGFSGISIASSKNGATNSSSSSGEGSYKIERNNLTLTYSNGRQETHSFFICPENEKETPPGLIVIDGVSLLLRKQ
jgi:hypothetical protein